MPEMHTANLTIGEFMVKSLNVSSYRTYPEQMLLSMLFSLYTIVGISGNAMVLISVFKIRNWSGLEGAMMCFLTNLAVSDFLLCCITFPATAISAAADRWILSEAMCWFVGFVCSYLRIVSILLMMWIGVHRALVIKYPFHKKISENGAKVISVAVWVMASIPQITCFVNISPLHYDPDRAICIASILSDSMIPVAIYALVYLLIPMGTIILVYSLLLYIAVRAVRHHDHLTAGNLSDKRQRGMSTAHRKAFGTVFAQIGAFLVCFFPFVIFVGLTSIDEDMVPKRLQVYGACSSSLSAILNPVVYLHTNKTFKKFVMRMLTCDQGDGQSDNPNTYRNTSAMLTYNDNNSKLCNRYSRSVSEVQMPVLAQATPFSSLQKRSTVIEESPTTPETPSTHYLLPNAPHGKMRNRAKSDSSLYSSGRSVKRDVPVIDAKGIFIPVPITRRSVSDCSLNSSNSLVSNATIDRSPSAVLIVSDQSPFNKCKKITIQAEGQYSVDMVKLEEPGRLEPRVSNRKEGKL